MQKPSPQIQNSLANLSKQISAHSETALKYLFSLSAKFGRSGEVAGNNYQLGLKHLAAGNYGDAVFRFKAVTWLQPENIEAWYNLATSYLAARRVAESVATYRKTLALKPNHEEAAYMLAVALGKKAQPNEMPRNMPRSLATAHFNSLAATFDQEQVEKGGYRGHYKLADAVRGAVQPGRIDHKVLDMGCGTGLVGAQLRSIAGYITGLDIAPAMLAQAMQRKDDRQHKIYDELIERDVAVFLKDAPASEYDIVAAGAAFSFIGDLEAIFAQAHRTLRAGGLMAFTADKTDSKGYVFDPAGGRFRFSRDYLQQLAATCGFQELRFEEIEAYPGYQVWLVILKK